MLDREAEAFWRFSLSFYARPQVSEALLSLQDRDGRDVNLILFALWRAANGGARLAAGDFAVAETIVAEVRDEIILPLRQLRRRLKAVAAEDVQDLRRHILAVELSAERAIQTRLAIEDAQQRARIPATTDRLATARANLATYLGSAADGPTEALTILAAFAEMIRD